MTRAASSSAGSRRTTTLCFDRLASASSAPGGAWGRSAPCRRACRTACTERAAPKPTQRNRCSRAARGVSSGKPAQICVHHCGSSPPATASGSCRAWNSFSPSAASGHTQTRAPPLPLPSPSPSSSIASLHLWARAVVLSSRSRFSRTCTSEPASGRAESSPKWLTGGDTSPERLVRTRCSTARMGSAWPPDPPSGAAPCSSSTLGSVEAAWAGALPGAAEELGIHTAAAPSPPPRARYSRRWVCFHSWPASSGDARAQPSSSRPAAISSHKRLSTDLLRSSWGAPAVRAGTAACERARGALPPTCNDTSTSAPDAGAASEAAAEADAATWPGSGPATTWSASSCTTTVSWVSTERALRVISCNWR
mmetsp:Transcript_18898/g.36053  ORF Transcript_18898/g.36053 Transcript_18898/m.36053 type:complete len:366 (-) Transcript_18898:665-1762(-)